MMKWGQHGKARAEFFFNKTKSIITIATCPPHKKKKDKERERE